MTSQHERPFLYVLATQPSTPNQPATSEWIIEINKPQPTGLKPLSTVTHPKYSKHHRFSTLASRANGQQDSQTTTTATNNTTTTSTSATPEPAQEQAQTSSPSPSARLTSPSTASSPATSTFFSRLHPRPSDSLPTATPLPIILRIAVASIPYQHSHQITSDLEAECTLALESVHTTPDPASWLRQALLALQGKAVLPPVSHDFDVTKFLSVAEESLERTLTTSGSRGGSTSKAKEVKYRKLLRAESGGEDADEEDEGEGEPETHHDDAVEGAHGANVANDWSLPHRERKSVSERGVGSAGAGAGVGADAGRAAWERRNVYGGGLM